MVSTFTVVLIQIDEQASRFSVHSEQCVCTVIRFLGSLLKIIAFLVVLALVRIWKAGLK